MRIRASYFLIHLSVIAFLLTSLPVKSIFYPVMFPEINQSFGKVGLISCSDGTFYPESVEDILGAYEYAAENKGNITIRGSGLSFGEQALPPKENGLQHFILSTEKLNRIQHLPEDETETAIVLRVGAGVTWKAAITWVKQNLHMDVIPFDTPIGSDITIAGAFNAHTHSRDSDVNSCYMADYVNRLTLVTPRGAFLCEYPDMADTSGVGIHASSLPGYSSSLTPKEMTLSCKLLPGSLGKTGVVTDLEIRLKKINHKNRYVQSEVTYENCHLQEFIQQYIQATSNDEMKERYDHGVIGVLQWREEDFFRGFMISAKTVNEKPGLSPSFPGFDGPGWFNQFCYALGHAWAGSHANDACMNYYMSKGTIGVDTPFHWSYFHDNLVEAGKTLHKHPWLSAVLYMIFGIDKSLNVAHQTWFIPGDNAEPMAAFIKNIWELTYGSHEQFDQIKNMVLLQDLIRLPVSRHPAHITYDKGHGHAYTLTLAVHNKKEEEQAIALFKKVTDQAYESGIVPLLLKGNYVSDEILRTSKKEYIQQVREISEKTDPEQLLSSALWQRLLEK